MKAEDIDNMQAGREMDALIIKYVFGLEPQECMVGGHPRGCPGNTQYPPYSTDIAAAWLVVEHFKGYGAGVQIRIVNRFAEAIILDSKARADSAPLAICRAALKAIAPKPDIQPLIDSAVRILNHPEPPMPQATPSSPGVEVSEPILYDNLNELFHNRLTNRGKQTLANQAIEDIEQQEGAGK